MSELKHDPPYLTADEAAELLRTTPKAVYNLASRGQLPGARRFRRRLLVSRKELLDFIEGGQGAA